MSRSTILLTGLLTGVLVLGAVACKTPPVEGDAEDDETAGIATLGDTGIATLEGESGDKLDVMSDSDAMGETVGCEKIDFLFVIDSSGSMEDNQANLIASFPGLVTAMMTHVQAEDWHIMVVDVDRQWGGTDCQNACATLGSCPDAPEFDCQTPPPTLCDITLGGGVIAPMGEAASNQDCALATSSRYIEASEPDLLSAFSCVAQVGVDGGDEEQPIAALMRAVSPELVGPGECNDGFVRDDAILVVTIITDEPDQHSEGDPADWFDAVVAAKNMQAEAVVVLGLLPDGELAMPLCGAEAVATPRMSAFLDLFDASVRASVCEPDYSPFFEDAVEVISEACDNFTPS